mgnify:CR=1 FL=1
MESGRQIKGRNELEIILELKKLLGPNSMASFNYV